MTVTEDGMGAAAKPRESLIQTLPQNPSGPGPGSRGEAAGKKRTLPTGTDGLVKGVPGKARLRDPL